MWFRTTGTQKEWEELGEMTIRITSKQRISGAMKKKDRPEWMTDGQSAARCVKLKESDFEMCQMCAGGTKRELREQRSS